MIFNFSEKIQIVGMCNRRVGFQNAISGFHKSQNVDIQAVIFNS